MHVAPNLSCGSSHSRPFFFSLFFFFLKDICLHYILVHIYIGLYITVIFILHVHIYIHTYMYVYMQECSSVFASAHTCVCKCSLVFHECRFCLRVVRNLILNVQ